MEGLRHKSSLSTHGSTAAVSDCMSCDGSSCVSSTLVNTGSPVICKQPRLLMGGLASPTSLVASNRSSPSAAILHKLVIEFPVIDRSSSITHADKLTSPVSTTARIYRGISSISRRDTMSSPQSSVDADALPDNIYTTSLTSGEIMFPFR